MSLKTKSPILDSAGFPKIIPENIDLFGASDDDEVYWTNGDSGETRKIAYQSGSFKWVSVHREGPSLKNHLTGTTKKTGQSTDLYPESTEKKKAVAFNQTLLVFLLLSEQRKRSEARRKKEIDQLSGHQTNQTVQMNTQTGGQTLTVTTSDDVLTATNNTVSTTTLVPINRLTEQRLAQDERPLTNRQKKNFFLKNRQGGCFYGLLGGVPHSKTSFFRKFSCPNEQQITLYGIVNDINQSQLFMQSVFGEDLCQLLMAEGDLHGTTYDDRGERLDILILNYLANYLKNQQVTASGSLVLQINDLLQLISFNTPLETTVFWREEVVYPNSIQNRGDLFLRSFSSDKIPALDQYQIVLGSQAFWDDNRPGMIQSLWKLVVGDENLEQLIGNREEKDKVAICQRLVEKTSQKSSYQNKDVSVIYAQIPSSRSLEF